MKFRRLERNNTMSDEPDCVAKPRIDVEANHGIGDVETLLAEYLADADLQVKLIAVRQHLENILGDTHHQN